MSPVQFHQSVLFASAQAQHVHLRFFVFLLLSVVLPCQIQPCLPHIVSFRHCTVTIRHPVSPGLFPAVPVRRQPVLWLKISGFSRQQAELWHPPAVFCHQQVLLLHQQVSSCHLLILSFRHGSLSHRRKAFCWHRQAPCLLPFFHQQVLFLHLLSCPVLLTLFHHNEADIVLSQFPQPASEVSRPDYHRHPCN